MGWKRNMGFQEVRRSPRDSHEWSKAVAMPNVYRPGRCTSPEVRCILRKEESKVSVRRHSPQGEKELVSHVEISNTSLSFSLSLSLSLSLIGVLWKKIL
jgi:hypothetical protein